VIDHRRVERCRRTADVLRRRHEEEIGAPEVEHQGAELIGDELVDEPLEARRGAADLAAEVLAACALATGG
jgi:hypothetical protein